MIVTSWRGWLLCAVVIIGMMIGEWWMGRVLICTCGYVSLWEGDIWSAGNSQHVSDWYTFSHVIHGFIFYWIVWKLRHKLPVGWGLVLATLVEVGWELLENSPIIINRYREGTISLDYYGDSILNSVMDVGAMWVGFELARKLPVFWIVVAAVAMEIGVGWWIRDNLTLNVVMLVWPLDVVREWQMGGR